MQFFTTLLAACVALVGVAALPTVELATPSNNSTLSVRGGTASQTGTNNGYYYSFWTSGSMYVTYSNGNGGAYTVDWDGSGDFTAGKGWNPGSARYVFA
jgi:endo-1,4-beta-xylanase